MTEFAIVGQGTVVGLSERSPGTWPGNMNYAHHNRNWFAEVEGPTGKTRSAGANQTNFMS
ncbi:MAG: hypothetical protein M3305_10675 [Actinomycetota bacterium]|nr:hypothetical protein [Actinomycetota bacterium]